MVGCICSRGEAEQVSLTGIVEVKYPAECLQDTGRHALVAAFQTGVIFRANSGQKSNFLSAKSSSLTLHVPAP
jgi:hypothetical protein